MAIVKILKSSKSFRAVDYNENRVEKGEAVLLEAGNFNIPFNDKESYKAYLEKWTSSNKRIKNPQLHVVISLKGVVENNEQLVSIGKKWLEEMGYKNNPYLIYLHNNTSNSHIHIITSRIDGKGKKINHNFERKRSQKILNRINGVDELKELRVFASQLLKFSFQTKIQFVELCRHFNIQADADDKGISLTKNNVTINVSDKLLEFCSKRYRRSFDEKYKKSVQAKIFKYAALMDKESFVTYMRNAFGLKFIFYGKGENIYGFTILDLKNNVIYKGSEIFSLKKIKELLLSPKDNLSYCNVIIEDVLKSDKTTDIGMINDSLIKSGIYTDGLKIYSLNDDTPLGDLKPLLSKKLLYNTRVNNVLRDYNPQSEEEKMLLSKIHGIRKADLERDIPVKNKQNQILYYEKLIADAIHNGTDIRNTLENYGVSIHRIHGQFIIYDENNKFISSLGSMRVDKKVFEEKLYEYDKNFSLGTKYEDEYIGEDYDYQPEVLLMDVVAGLLDISPGGVSSLGKRKKKR